MASPVGIRQMKAFQVRRVRSWYARLPSVFKGYYWDGQQPRE